MLRNYLITAYRNLLRNKIFTQINIIGLSIGIGSMLLIAIFIHHELSYDQFFKDSSRIYRVALHRIYPDRERYFATSGAMIAEILKTHYEEVEESTRLLRLLFQNDMEVKVGEDTYLENHFYYADSSFFKVFSYDFIFGNPDQALASPNTVVLTASTAKKYFGTENALGKIIARDSMELMVTGIIRDIPSNSHIHFDLLGSIQQIPYVQEAVDNQAWINPWLHTYIKLKDGVKPKQLESKLDKMVDAYGQAGISKALGTNYAKEGHRFRYFLQPLESIHLHSNLDIEVEPNGNYNYVVMFGTIAIIILIVSVINYVNLATANASERAKEVGIRKVMGSDRRDLIIQFITESLILTLVSSLVSLLTVTLLLPIVSQTFGIPMSINILSNPRVLLILLIFISMVGVLSGLYPALTFALYHPVRLLKGGFTGNFDGILLRNSLTIFQFFISVVMISGAVGVYKQMQYLSNRELGFTKENVVVIRNNESDGTTSQAFCKAIKQLPEVVSVGSAFAMPGDFIGSNVVEISDRPDLQDIRVNSIYQDDEFMETLQFELLEGRGFSEATNDSLAVIVNESFVKSLGLNNTIGTRIKNIRGTLPDGTIPEVTIVGVLKDYNFVSLHSLVSPLVISNSEFNYNLPVLAVRINSSNESKTISLLESKWNEYSSKKFIYSFLDQNLERQYRSEFVSARIIDTFSLIAIIISCIGLFGVTTYILQLRLKEMSIRKILGAGSLGICVLFLKKFLTLVGVAFLLAVPVTWMLLNNWLQTFAYQIEIMPEIFLLSGGAVFFLVIGTLSYQAIKLMRVNPIDLIRG